MARFKYVLTFIEEINIKSITDNMTNRSCSSEIIGLTQNNTKKYVGKEEQIICYNRFVIKLF